MVGTVQPHGLFSFETDWRRRYQKMQPLRGNKSKQSSASGTTSESSVSRSCQGLVATEILLTSGRGRTIFLDNPFYRSDRLALAEDLEPAQILDFLGCRQAAN
jgi:hypothetical protein